jgi:hypothetical protein
MEEQPIESENVEVVQTTGGDDKAKRLQAVYSMLDSDEAYRPYVPATYDEFLGKIGKDAKYARAIHEMVASDEVYSQYLPATFDETVTYFGLGKPSPTPPSASGLGTQKNVGQTPMVPQEPSMPAPSSAPQYLSPEELGQVEQPPMEEVMQPQITNKPAPTPQEISPFQDQKVQDALKLEYLKKKAAESKKVSESYKGNMAGALWNSAAESYSNTVDKALYSVLSVMATVMPEGVDGGEQMTTEERFKEVEKSLKDLGMKETLDDALKSKGTTKEYTERKKLEGGPIVEGVFGLGESLYPMITPMQSGFFMTTFADSHKEIREEMPDISPEAQFMYAATQGTVVMLLNEAGLSNLVQNKSVMKNLTGKVVEEIKRMGAKVSPEVLESTTAKIVNGFFAEAETGASEYVAQESIKQIADALEGEKDAFEFEGWQNFFSNTLYAGAIEGIGGSVLKSLGEAAGALKSSEAKVKAEQDITQVSDMVNDLSNPNVTPQAKEAIKKTVDQKAEEILEAYTEEKAKIDGLSPELNAEFMAANDQVESANAVLQDPNVSESTKMAAQQMLDNSTKRIDEILSEAKPKVEEVAEAKSETKIEPNILLSGLREGWVAESYDAFDPREFRDLMTLINGQRSFAKVVEKKGKKYVVVGLSLSPESMRDARTSGRDNFSFAAVELNENTPSNIVETLENSARENFKNIYRDFSDKDSVSPIKEKDAELSDLEQKEKVAVVEETQAETPSIEAQVAEIKSKPLTRIEGAGMGSNQAVGTFVSTEPENRYAAQFPDAEVQSMEVDIENPFVTEDTNLIDYRNEMINRRKGELDETDFTEVEIPSGEFTIDDLSDSGIEKVAAMVTEEMKAKGYDSVYFPQTDTQEGELVVFDREKVRRKGEAMPASENIQNQTPTQDAAKTGEIQQDNQQKYQGAGGQQQGQQEDRTNQEGNVPQAEGQAGGVNIAAEGGEKKEIAIEDIDDTTVDKTDQTIIAYHATPTGKVSTGKEAGIHIGTKKAAEQVKAGRNQGKGTVEKVKTIIKRPLILSDMPSWSSANLLSQLFNPQTGQYFGLTRNDIRDIRDSDMTEKQKQQSVIDFLKKKGYDAIAYKNDSEDAGSYSYVLFEESTIESGSTISEGVGQTQAETQQEVTPEQQQRIDTRALLSEISDWNKLGRKAKRSAEGLTEMQRLKKAGKDLGLTIDTKAIKSGLRLTATNADGQVMTVDKVNKVMNPKRVTWNNGTYAAQTTQDVNGNPIVEFYDAKTGDQIRSNSNEGVKAKEAYYQGNVEKFLGTSEPVDMAALYDMFSDNQGRFNEALLEAVIDGDNAFEIAANYTNFVNYDFNLVDLKYDPTYELAQLVGQVSEEDFRKHFDRNFLNKNSKWIDPNYKGDDIASRISGWVTLDNEKGENDFAASLRGVDSSKILSQLSDLVQAYPDGPQSVKQAKEGELLPFASQKFRQITGKPLNAVTAAEFNQMYENYANKKAEDAEFGFETKVAWEDLTPEQKQQILNDQNEQIEQEFFLGEEDFGNEPDFQPETPVGEGEGEAVTKPRKESEVKRSTMDKPVKVYHGGTVSDINSLDEGVLFFVTESKREALDYAKGNDGYVTSTEIDYSKIAKESVARDILSKMGFGNEYMLHELIDPRFEESYIGDENVANLFSEIERQGYNGVEFMDNSVNQGGNVTNIVLTSPKKAIDKTTFGNNRIVNERAAYDLLEEGFRPIVDGNLINNITEDELGDLFRKSETIEMSKPIAENPTEEQREEKAQPIKKATDQIYDAITKLKTNRPNYLSSSIGSVVWDFAIDIVAATAKAGGYTAQSITNGINKAIVYVKDSEYYKALNDSTKRRFLSDFIGSVNSSITPEMAPDYSPILSVGEISKSSLKERMLNGNASKAVKQMIEESGIEFDTQNQELARQYANDIIREIGIDAAVDLAQRGVIKGAPKTFILGANVDAKVSSKGNGSLEAMEAINIFDEALRAAGREIAAAYRVYLNSPEGLYAFEKQKVVRNIDKKLSKGQKNADIKKTKNAVSKEGKSTAKDVAKDVVDGLKGKPPRQKSETSSPKVDNEKQKAAQKKKANALAKLKASSGLTSGGFSKEFFEGLVELGTANIELGYYKVEAWLKQMKKDLKSAGIDNVSDDDILSVLDQTLPDGTSMASTMEAAKWESAAETLATKINSIFKKPSTMYDPVQSIINGLYQKVAEKVSIEKKKPLSDIDKAKALIENYEEAKQVWERAKELEIEKIESMDISEQDKAALIFDIDFFFEETIGFPLSETAADKLITNELKDRIKSGESITDAIEKILADAFVYGTNSKDAMIKSISDKLQLNVNLSAADANAIAKKFADRYDKKMSDYAQNFLDKQFKPKPLENEKKRKQQHSSIARQIIWGALDDARFRGAFYDKYGFDFLSDPKFDQALKELTREVYKAPEGFLRDEAQANLNAFVRIAEKGFNYWSIPNALIVDNLLAGTETMIKALDSNTINTIAIAGQMIAKDPKNAKFIAEKLFTAKGKKDLLSISLRKMGGWMGLRGMKQRDEADNADISKLLAENHPNKYMKGLGYWMQKSGRLLTAIDYATSMPAKYTKFADLMLADVKARGNKLSDGTKVSQKQAEAIVNEILGETTEAIESAMTQAEADITTMFPNEQINTKAKIPNKATIAYKNRVFEILEQKRMDRANDIKSKVDWMADFTEDELAVYEKYASKYADKVSLMGTPNGSLGMVALGMKGVGQQAPILRFLQAAPWFINAPLNLTNMLYDSIPLVGLSRAASFMIKGRRGLLVSDKAADQLGLFRREDNERLYKEQRNSLLKRVAALQVASITGLMLAGFFDDDEEKDKYKTITDYIKSKGIYMTGSLSVNPEKASAIEKATGLKPYFLYIDGKEVMSYRNNALLSVFGLTGNVLDSRNFGNKEDEELLSSYVNGVGSTIAFINETSALRGFSDAIAAYFSIGKYEGATGSSVDRVMKSLAKSSASSLQATILPRVIPSTYKDIQGALLYDKKKATNFLEFMVNDVPFLEDMIVTKQYDHFGEPLKEEFFVPSPLGGLSLIGWENGTFAGPFQEVQSQSKYYRMAQEAGYKPTAYKETKYEVEVSPLEYLDKTPSDKTKGLKADIEEQGIKGEPKKNEKGMFVFQLNISPEKLAEINQVRGQFVRTWLDKNEAIFIQKTKGERNNILKNLYTTGTTLAKGKVLNLDNEVYRFVPVEVGANGYEVSGAFIPTKLY